MGMMLVFLEIHLNIEKEADSAAPVIPAKAGIDVSAMFSRLDPGFRRDDGRKTMFIDFEMASSRHVQVPALHRA
jgi:hypothetical protein